MKVYKWDLVSCRELVDRAPSAKVLFRTTDDDQPFTPCGSSIGKGWLEPVAECLRAIAQVTPEVYVDQIKQKFCGLRLYLEYGGGVSLAQREAVEELISQAEAICWRTCERCGAEKKYEGPKTGQNLCEECTKAGSK